MICGKLAGKITIKEICFSNTVYIDEGCEMFYGLQDVEKIELTNVEFAYEGSMAYMFAECPKLKEINFANMDFSGTTEMNSMFEGDISLESLDLSGWDVEYVSLFYSMFSGCTSLKDLNVSNWHFDGDVTDMEGMFYECSSLETLDLSTWNTAGVECVTDMFYGCTSLKYLDMTGCNFYIIEDSEIDIFDNTRIWNIVAPRLNVESAILLNDIYKVRTVDGEEFETDIIDDNYGRGALLSLKTTYTLNRWEQKVDAQSDEFNEDNFTLISSRVDEAYAGDKPVSPPLVSAEFIEKELLNSNGINGDGTTVRDIIEIRKKYTVNESFYIINGNISSGKLHISSSMAIPNLSYSGFGQYRFGDTVTLTVEVPDEYDFENWEDDFSNGVGENKNLEYTFTMPAQDVHVGAIVTIKNYPVDVEKYYENELGEYVLEKTEKYSAPYNSKVSYVGEMAGLANEFKKYAKNNSHPDSIIEGTVPKGGLVLKAYYDRNKSTISYDCDNNIESIEGPTSYKWGNTVRLKANLKTGYEADKWYVYSSENGILMEPKPYEELANSSDDIEVEVPPGRVFYKATAKPKTDTPYTIEYYTEDLDGNYSIYDTKELTGTTDTIVYSFANEIEGFTLNLNKEGTITETTLNGDGSTVLKLYYDRNTYDVLKKDYVELNFDIVSGDYKITLDPNGPAAFEKLEGFGTYKYGEKVVLDSKIYDYCIFKGWLDNKGYLLSEDAKYEFTMPAYDIEISPSYNYKDYEFDIEYYNENENGEYILRNTYTGKGRINALVEAGEFNTIDIQGSVRSYYFDANNENNVLSGRISKDEKLVLKMCYERTNSSISYNYDDGIESVEGPSRDKWGRLIAIKANPKPGYAVDKWYVYSNSVIVPPSYNYSLIESDTDTLNTNLPLGDVYYKVTSKLSDDIPYSVNYWGQKLDGEYELVYTDNLFGSIKTNINVIPREINGYQFDEANSQNQLSGEIEIDGSTEFNVYLTRRSYDVSIESDDGIVKAIGEGSYPFGSTFNVNAFTKIGYNFGGWYEDDRLLDENAETSFEMPIGGILLKAKSSPKDGTYYAMDYYIENEDGSFSRFQRVDCDGVTDSEVTIEEITIDGYVVDKTVEGTIEKGTIKHDGNLTLKLYYRILKYDLVIENVEGVENISGAGRYKPDEDVTIQIELEDNYRFIGWTNSDNEIISTEVTYSFKMPNNDLTIKPVVMKINIDVDDDGIPDINIDLDGDNIPDINIDTDGDFIADVDIDTNGDNEPDINIDTTGDKVANINIDTDGDNEPDINIDTTGDNEPNINIDTTGDKIPNINIDTTGDLIPNVNIDLTGNGIPDINIDTTGDLIPNLNIDTDGDKKPDVNIDTDGDNEPNINIDTTGDNIPNINIDTDGDNEPDINIDTTGDNQANINIDTDGDNKPDVNIDTTGDNEPNINIDTTGDNIPNINIDTDGDNEPDVNIDTTGDNQANINIDTDGDNKPDVNIDIDEDGEPDINIDTTGDNIPNINIDTDGDNEPDVNIDTTGDNQANINIDTDGDNKADVNIDTTGDNEPNINIDTDGDNNPDINIDTDGDNNPDINIDTTGDNIPNINVDTDGDNYPDINIDIDGDDEPDINIDTDNDNVADNNIYESNDLECEIKDDKYIVDIKAQMPVEEFIENIISEEKDEDVEVRVEENDNNIISTGAKVVVTKNDKVVKVYTVIVTGDVDGDGKASYSDTKMIKAHRVELLSLNEIQKLAADINKNGKIDSDDYKYILLHRLEVEGYNLNY